MPDAIVLPQSERLMNSKLTVTFPEKRYLGSLYTAEEQFPHPRKWIGEARGKMQLSCRPHPQLIDKRASEHTSVF